MSFRITARTILQLGAELISSDAIAFYELIKNAFDARSERVSIRVVVHVPYDVQRELRSLLDAYQYHNEIGASTEGELHRVQDRLISSIDLVAPEGIAIKQAATEAASYGDLQDIGFRE